MEPSQGGAGDRELMARLAAGDREALAPLMERHYRRLYRIALAYLRQPDDALDVVQEAFVKAYQSAARWDGSAEAGPWLVAHHGEPRRSTAGGATGDAPQTFTPLAEGDHDGVARRPRRPGPDRGVAGREAGERAGRTRCGRCPSGSARSSCCATTRT